MAINGRKSHIKRCLGVTKNSSGGLDDDPDSYLDLLRTDEFDYTTSDGQGFRFIIKWADDTLKEDASNYDNAAGITGRKTELGKGTDPELPFEKDPDSYVPYRVINELTIQDSNGQGIKYIFKNKNATDNGVPIPTTREIDIIRLYYYDINVDDQLNDKDGTHIVKDEDYARKSDTEDKDQYADMEVLKNWVHALHGHNKDTVDGQEEKVVLHNADIYNTILGISIQESISPGTNSSGDPTIPGRMDPFTNVLNAQWGLGAVKILDKAS